MNKIQRLKVKLLGAVYAVTLPLFAQEPPFGAMESKGMELVDFMQGPFAIFVMTAALIGCGVMWMLQKASWSLLGRILIGGLVVAFAGYITGWILGAV